MYLAKAKVLIDDLTVLYLSNVCLIGMEAVVRNGQVIGYIRRADYGFFIDQPMAYG